MIVVVDTNVLVSALLTPFGSPANVIQLIQSGSVLLVVDTRIFAEYRIVLTRPAFEFDSQIVAALLEFIVSEADFISCPPLHLKLPDPDDLPFLEVAVASKVDALITGNKRHFPDKLTQKLGIKVQNPSEFLFDFIVEN